MTAGAAEPSAAERAAIFKAAGFKAKGDKYVRCEDDVTMSYSPKRIEMEDLNADGTAEAWVKEGSLFCYGTVAPMWIPHCRQLRERLAAAEAGPRHRPGSDSREAILALIARNPETAAAAAS